MKRCLSRITLWHSPFLRWRRFDLESWYFSADLVKRRVWVLCSVRTTPATEDLWLASFASLKLIDVRPDFRPELDQQRHTAPKGISQVRLLDYETNSLCPEIKCKSSGEMADISIPPVGEHRRKRVRKSTRSCWECMYRTTRRAARLSKDRQTEEN